VIEPGHRIFACGKTGSGKSLLLGYYFATTPGQRLLIDVNDDYELGPAALEEGASDVRGDPDALDWSKRTLRYVPGRLTFDEYEDLYKVIWDHAAIGHKLFVWLDECYGPTTESRCPMHLRKAITQGRKKDLTHGGAGQRPVGIEKTLVNQAEHLFSFFTADRDDVDMLARRMSITPAECAEALHNLPEHAYLYHRLGRPEVTAFPPLPPERLKTISRAVRMP
jgi:hypothetical protein